MAPMSHVSISVFEGTVKVDGVSVAVPARELALLMTLALRKDRWTASELANLLWGQHTRKTSVVKVCVHRLRKRIGRAVIWSDALGYRLNPLVEVDLWKAQTRAQLARLRERQPHALRNWFEQAQPELDAALARAGAHLEV